MHLYTPSPTADATRRNPTPHRRESKKNERKKKDRGKAFVLISLLVKKFALVLLAVFSSCVCLCVLVLVLVLVSLFHFAHSLEIAVAFSPMARRLIFRPLK